MGFTVALVKCVVKAEVFLCSVNKNERKLDQFDFGPNDGMG